MSVSHWSTSSAGSRCASKFGSHLHDGLAVEPSLRAVDHSPSGPRKSSGHGRVWGINSYQWCRSTVPTHSSSITMISPPQACDMAWESR